MARPLIGWIVNSTHVVLFTRQGASNGNTVTDIWSISLLLLLLLLLPPSVCVPNVPVCWHLEMVDVHAV